MTTAGNASALNLPEPPAAEPSGRQGKVSDLATAQAQTRDLLRALRAHMKKAVDDGTDISAAVKSFNAQPFAHLRHADVWIPQLANMTYLEMERE